MPHKQAAESIVNGLSFLVAEAENNGLQKVAAVLKICARDVRISLEEFPEDKSAPITSLGTDMYMALKFVSRYAAIKDDIIRKEILEEIEKIQKLIQKCGASRAA